MNMKKVLLGETCEILDSQRVPITSTERKSGIYPYYGANGLQDYVDGYLFDDELVLLAEDGGNFGSKDRPIAYRVSGKCWVNNHAHVLKPKTPYDVDYICYALMFYDTTGLVNGATRQKLTQSAMRQMQIPYRSWDEQKVIVSKINAVIELIEARKEQTNYLDDLVKSRFIEMFGEPNHGDKFEKASGKDLFVFSSGKFLPEDKRKSEGVAVYGGNGIAWYTTEPLITHETIVIGRVGAYCGNVRYVKEPIWITDNAIYIKAFKKNCFSIVYFVRSIFLSFSSWIKRLFTAFFSAVDKGIDFSSEFWSPLLFSVTVSSSVLVDSGSVGSGSIVPLSGGAMISHSSFPPLVSLLFDSGVIMTSSSVSPI